MPALSDLDALTGRTFAAVLFDNDGTLVDSTPAVERAWSRWATEYGVPLTRLHGHHGVPARDIVRELAPDADTDAALARITALELTDVDDIVTLPGAVDAVRALSPRRCAIVTSATRDLAVVRLRAAGIPLPEVIVTFDDVVHGKPHPEPFVTAARRLGVDPGDCLVVEDAPSGLAAARAAGCTTLALTSTAPAEHLDGDAVVTSLAEVQFEQTTQGVELSPAPV